MAWYACLALVLLRVALGWHFLVEGLAKIDSYREGTKPFSAAGFVSNASGPLRPLFRAQLDDPDGLKRLEPATASAEWQETIDDLDRRYGLTETQKMSAQAKIRQLEIEKDRYFSDPDTQAKITKYRADLERTDEDEQNKLAYERERAKTRRRDLQATRDELIGPVDSWDQALRDQVTKELTADQIEQGKQTGRLGHALGLPFALTWPSHREQQMSLVVMIGLTLIGGLLLIGLFSRMSALGAAVFLALVYLINPPPPLGAGNPADPGHYWYVNKELVECCAALVLATIPTGRWLGLDALIRGLITRRISYHWRKQHPPRQPVLTG